MSTYFSFLFLALPALFHLPKLFFSIVLLLFLLLLKLFFHFHNGLFGGRMFIVGTASSSKWKTATQHCDGDGRRERDKLM